MIKKYIKKKGVSVYEAAKASQIPYTTLNELVNGKKSFLDCNFKTIQKLSAYLGVSMEELYQNETKKKVTPATTWEDAKKKTYSFPVIDPSDNYDASRIHPLKQRAVKRIYNACLGDPRIETIILFGSSTNIRCNKFSDLDLAVRLKENSVEFKHEVSEKILNLCDYKADIVWLDTLDSSTLGYQRILNGVKLK